MVFEGGAAAAAEEAELEGSPRATNKSNVRSAHFEECMHVCIDTICDTWALLYTFLQRKNKSKHDIFRQQDHRIAS